jgi:hypothetical protein
MTELDQAILKLRIRFHRRLAERLGLTIDKERIHEHAERLNDKELFKYTENYNRRIRERVTKAPVGPAPEPQPASKLVRFIRSTVIGRFKTFIKK